jgi:hypothetical protein
MTIRVEVKADSLNVATGDRLTTFLLAYPRMIHSELMTHRVFSRNAASSLAIPVEKMLLAVMEDPAMPVEWGTMKAGMQAGPPLEGAERNAAMQEWWSARTSAVQHARRLLQMGLHKQVANRLLEPFGHITTLVSATEWLNFFRLRAHPDADPTFQALAYEMLDEYLGSVPRQVEPGFWHLPFIQPEDTTDLFKLEKILKANVARDARVSYLRQDGVWDIDGDVVLAEKLAAVGHWSPFEHVAQATEQRENLGNFRGWDQYRHLLDTASRADLSQEEINAELRAILFRRPAPISGTD